jgi:hypothetical protein
MRIAYHNPWVSSSENQIYMSMAEAGRRIGIDLVACADEKDIEACRPDFVLAVASSVASRRRCSSNRSSGCATCSRSTAT